MLLPSGAVRQWSTDVCRSLKLGQALLSGFVYMVDQVRGGKAACRQEAQGVFVWVASLRA